MPAKLSILSAAALSVSSLALSGVLACGGDDGPVRVVGLADASIDAPEPCKAAPSYTPAFGSDQTADDYPAMGSGADATLHQIYYTGTLDPADPADYLFIDLYAEYGAFAGTDIGSGSFTLTGDDANYSSCGVCVTIAADTSAAGDVDDWYMAGGGIVTLTSVTTRLTGTLSNVSLRRVITDPDGGPSDALQGDCVTRITSASFDAPLTLGSATARAVAHVPLRVLRHRHRTE